MISEPHRYLDEFLAAGCDAVTFHLEAESEPAELLRRIRDHDAVAGLAINPDTPIEDVEPLLDDCDLLLIMSVTPGFGGQKFQSHVLPKVERARALAGDRLLISMDGGIGLDTIAVCAEVGTDTFVAGSAIFDETDYAVAGPLLADAALRAQQPAEETA